MPRSSVSGWRYEPSVDLTIALIVGAASDLDVTGDMLEVGWRVEGDRLMESCRRNPNPGWRPWGWWRFVACEERPDDEAAEAARLAELDELRDDEMAALRERAAGSERWARVLEAISPALRVLS